MKTARTVLLGMLTVVLVAPAFAQPGPGMGGMGPGRMAFSQGNTPGWSLMSQEERAAHREKMWSFKTYDECKVYQADHHKAMGAKAKDQGKTLPAPKANACDRMKAQGQFK
ncbi:MAG: hypothetical protein HZA62_12170 [Rhodocyclales bacterium]|nr:hypothetical protein [Rhodocyclales bacterium]